ncbi:unnamed protein product, partial [Porites evermanni]
SPSISQPSFTVAAQKATVPGISLLNRLDHLDRSPGHKFKTPTPTITSVKPNVSSNIIILQTGVSDITGAIETVFSNGRASSVPLQLGADLEVLPNITTDLLASLKDKSKIIHSSRRRDPAVHSRQINVTVQDCSRSTHCFKNTYCYFSPNYSAFILVQHNVAFTFDTVCIPENTRHISWKCIINNHFQK